MLAMPENTRFFELLGWDFQSIKMPGIPSLEPFLKTERKMDCVPRLGFDTHAEQP